MSQKHQFSRRTFLRGAGATAVLGAVGARPGGIGGAADLVASTSRQSFDFDEIYDRRGTDCTKWDRAIAAFGEDIEVGMGIADMDFRAAPCITEALAKRCDHENWGYLARPAS